MTFKLSRTFFVPLASIIFLLSLSSCGKDYDLVSEYVIRDANEQVQLSTIQDDNILKISAVHTSSNSEIKKK
jgi:hypothetical protein